MHLGIIESQPLSKEMQNSEPDFIMLQPRTKSPLMRDKDTSKTISQKTNGLLAVNKSSNIFTILNLLFCYIAIILAVMFIFAFGLLHETIGISILLGLALIAVVVWLLFVSYRKYSKQTLFPLEFHRMTVLIWLLFCGFVLGYSSSQQVKTRNK